MSATANSPLAQASLEGAIARLLVHPPSDVDAVLGDLLHELTGTRLLVERAQRPEPPDGSHARARSGEKLIEVGGWRVTLPERGLAARWGHTIRMLLTCASAARQLAELSRKAGASQAEVATLQDVAGAILTIHDIDQVLLTINDRLIALLDADIAGAFLIDGDELVMKGCTGHHLVATARLRMRRGQGVAGLVFETGEPQKVDEYLLDRKISADFHQLAVDEKARSALAVPLRIRSQMTGVIEVWRRRESVFTADDVRRMNALSTLAAIAIDNARLYESQSAAMRDLAQAREQLEAQIKLLHQSASLQRTLTELVLQSASLPDLVRAAAHETGCGAVVTTADRQPLAGHPPELAAGDAMVALLARRPIDAAPEPRPIAHDLADGRTVWVHPVTVGVEVIGYVYLVTAEARAAFMETACGQTAAACALHYLEESAARNARAEAADEALWDLLAEQPEQRRQALARARRLHLDVDGERRLLLGTIRELKHTASVESWTPSQTDRVRHRIRDAVREAARRHGFAGSTRDDRIIVIGRGELAVCRSVAEEISALIAAQFEGVTLGWGISGICQDPECLPAAHHEAEAAGELAERLRSRTALAYDELGVVRLMASTSPEGDLDAFVEEVIGPLQRYDNERNGALIETLEAFFRANCLQNKAAEALFVHPKTLRYRLELVRELAGLDLTSHVDRMRADLALRIHQIRQASPHADGGAAPSAAS